MTASQGFRAPVAQKTCRQIHNFAIHFSDDDPMTRCRRGPFGSENSASSGTPSWRADQAVYRGKVGSLASRISQRDRHHDFVLILPVDLDPSRHDAFDSKAEALVETARRTLAEKTCSSTVPGRRRVPVQCCRQGAVGRCRPPDGSAAKPMPSTPM